MYGSNSNHTERQYWAVDSITASSTPCSRNQTESRRISLAMGAKSSSFRFLFRRGGIDHHHHQHFLVHVNACYLVRHR
jgi:hypothetical protein